MQKIIIAVIGDKGGIGKTLLSYNLIYRLFQDTKSCELIDCDNDQFSSADFAQERIDAKLSPLPVVKVSTKDLKDYLQRNEDSRSKEISIIEFGKAFGEDEVQRKAALRMAVKIADVVFSIMQASPVDVKAFGKFEDKLPEEIAKIPAILIPNRVKSKKRLKSLLDSAPQLNHFKITKSFISDKLCYQDSFGDEGRSIFEIRGFDKNDKLRPLNKQEINAKKEFEELYQELIQYICN